VTIDVIRGDATALPLADKSVHCVVTSPPYRVGLDYGSGVSDSGSWDDYIELAQKASKEIHRVLVPGGRVWVNVQPTVPEVIRQKSDTPDPNSTRKSLLFIWHSALDKAGLLYRDLIMWDQDSYDGACAWGSRQMPSAPNQRGGHESILCFYKDHWKRQTPDGFKGWYAPKEDLGGEWYNDLCRNVWRIRPSRAKTPAPFPVDLPARCIRLSTWPTETVLDPFCGGNATTLQAARALGRHGVGVELGTDMVQMAKVNAWTEA
jgi:DNA modification methylase